MMFSSGLVAYAFVLVSSLASVTAETHYFEWVIDEWVVDFMRPTIALQGGILPWQKGMERQVPFKIPEEQRKHALLINGQYPGPPIDVYENDTVVVKVINKMSSEATTIHWHGIHQIDTPWMDGPNGITQGPILPGQEFTYEFKAYPAGTHWYHSHMDAVQSAAGIKGAFIVKKRQEPFKKMYDQELLVQVSDEWREPSVCLRNEGAMAGNPVCGDIRHVSFNGQYGMGTDKYPYPMITVEKGKCYRLRYIFMGINTENLVVRMAGHHMTLIAKDGYDVKPINISSFNMHLGERYDVVVCADQEPGNYLISAQYDYACTLTESSLDPPQYHFIPPGFSAVPACEFYAFLNYKGHTDAPQNQRGSPNRRPPLGSGGGREPRKVEGVDFDLTRREGYRLTEALVPEEEPEQPDVRYVINIGLNGAAYSTPTDAPFTKGRYYMDVAGPDGTGGPRRSWHTPSSPLYLTRGQCGVPDIPVINVPENATTVELVINNLSPAAHVLHLHGLTFKVINFANHEWCLLNRTDCFIRPHWLQVGGCDKEDVTVGDPSHPNLVGGLFWGCRYNEKKNRKDQWLKAPLMHDTVQIWQRSWLVMRFKATNPGIWFAHCHLDQHLLAGMQMAFNILPSKQPLAPANIPTAGNCPFPGMAPHPDLEKKSLASALAENDQLKRTIEALKQKK